MLNLYLCLCRRIVWEQNLRFVQKHNIEYTEGKHSFTLAMNKFADMTPNEFALVYSGYEKSTTNNAQAKVLVTDIPDSIDWRVLGYVGPVKDQGKCAAGWAISATSALESKNFRIFGFRNSFSEQNLIDCSRSYGNNGCQGGNVRNAYSYVQMHQIDPESAYPYTGKV